jgi:hypothetical protein
MSVCPSERPSAWNNWAPTGWIFMKFDKSIFENLSIKFKFQQNLTRIAGTLHKDQYSIQFDHIAQFFLKWEMSQTKIVEKIKTRVLHLITLLCLSKFPCVFFLAKSL